MMFLVDFVLKYAVAKLHKLSDSTKNKKSGASLKAPLQKANKSNSLYHLLLPLPEFHRLLLAI